MRTIDLGDNAPNLQELLHLASEGNLILRTPDGKEFVLAEVDDFDLEIALTRQQPELMKLLTERSRPGRTYHTLDQARKLLDLD